jgi:lipopolysaccharide export system protein LptA
MRRSAMIALILIAQSASAQQSVGRNIYPAPDTPIKIFADTFRFDESRNSASYLGNVQVVQGSVRVHCMKATVQYERSQPGNTASIARINCEQ